MSTSEPPTTQAHRATRRAEGPSQLRTFAEWVRDVDPTTTTWNRAKQGAVLALAGVDSVGQLFDPSDDPDDGGAAPRAERQPASQLRAFAEWIRDVDPTTTTWNRAKQWAVLALAGVDSVGQLFDPSDDPDDERARELNIPSTGPQNG